MHSAPVLRFDAGTASALTVNGLGAVLEAYRFHGVHPLTVDLGKVLFAAMPAAMAGGAVVLAIENVLVDRRRVAGSRVRHLRGDAPSDRRLHR